MDVMMNRVKAGCVEFSRQYRDVTKQQCRNLARMLSNAGTHDAVYRALQYADKILGGHGIECIRGEWHDQYYQDSVASYVNMGDTYNLTLLRDHVRGTWHVCDWGSWVEANTERYGIE